VTVVDRVAARRGLRGPLLAAAAAIGATLYVGVVDPSEPGHYPACPLKATTGLDCPGCGGLRCVYALTRGDIVGAADQNLLAVLVLPLMVVAWFGWAARSAGRAGMGWPSWVLPAVLWASLAFTLLRNLPVPVLGSGVG
jgi:Protein of unknown function (DUF2752)